MDQPGSVREKNSISRKNSHVNICIPTYIPDLSFKCYLDYRTFEE